MCRPNNPFFPRHILHCKKNVSNLNINMRGPPIRRRRWKIERNRPSVFKIFTRATEWEISVLFFTKIVSYRVRVGFFLYSEVMSMFFFYAWWWREVGYDLNELPRVNARQWESHTYLVSTLSSVFQRLPLRRTVDRIFFGNERGWCDRWVKTLPFIFFSNVAYRERSLKINVRVCV